MYYTHTIIMEKPEFNVLKIFNIYENQISINLIDGLTKSIFIFLEKTFYRKVAN